VERKLISKERKDKLEALDYVLEKFLKQTVQFETDENKIPTHIAAKDKEKMFKIAFLLSISRIRKLYPIAVIAHALETKQIEKITSIMNNPVVIDEIKQDFITAYKEVVGAGAKASVNNFIEHKSLRINVLDDPTKSHYHLNLPTEPRIVAHKPTEYLTQEDITALFNQHPTSIRPPTPPSPPIEEEHGPHEPIVHITLDFNLANPAAKTWVEENAGQLVKYVTDDVQKTIREIITRSFVEGIKPYDAAKLISESIGLLPKHEVAVNNLRTRLGRTTDMNMDEINKEVSEYRQKLLMYRAKNIARTETLKGSLEGQRQVWDEAIQRGLLDRARTLKKWIITDDDRICILCLSMIDAEPIPLDEDFETPLGPMDGPLMHPSCRCAQALVIISRVDYYASLKG
jgi:hypothetical protein